MIVLYICDNVDHKQYYDQHSYGIITYQDIEVTRQAPLQEARICYVYEKCQQNQLGETWKATQPQKKTHTYTCIVANVFT